MAKSKYAVIKISQGKMNVSLPDKITEKVEKTLFEDFYFLCMSPPIKKNIFEFLSSSQDEVLQNILKNLISFLGAPAVQTLRNSLYEGDIDD